MPPFRHLACLAAIRFSLGGAALAQGPSCGAPVPAGADFIQWPGRLSMPESSEVITDVAVSKLAMHAWDQSNLTSPGWAPGVVLPSLSATARLDGDAQQHPPETPELDSRTAEDAELSAVFLDLLVRGGCREGKCWHSRPRQERELEASAVSEGNKQLRPVSFHLRESAGGRLLAHDSAPAPLVTSLRSLRLH